MRQPCVAGTVFVGSAPAVPSVTMAAVLRASRSFVRAARSFVRAARSFVRAARSFVRAARSFVRAGPGRRSW
jgi:hypothetical protein